ncbi:MAG: hypothetical protein ACEPOW_12840 [Bacteroidales bacterium]
MVFLCADIESKDDLNCESIFVCRYISKYNGSRKTFQAKCKETRNRFEASFSSLEIENSKYKVYVNFTNGESESFDYADKCLMIDE